MTSKPKSDEIIFCPKCLEPRNISLLRSNGLNDPSKKKKIRGI